MAKTAAEKIELLEAEIKKYKQREKSKLRAVEKRKKMLIGEFVYSVMKKDGISAEVLTYGSRSFSQWLTGAAGRELFGFKDSKPDTGKNDD